MAEGPTISTHVLDTERGMPGVAYAVSLYRVEDGESRLVGSGMTDEDGRIRRLMEEPLAGGEYRIEVEISGAFFLRAALTFVVEDLDRSYHVPLLLSPYSLTTYRGS